MRVLLASSIWWAMPLSWWAMPLWSCRTCVHVTYYLPPYACIGCCRAGRAAQSCTVMLALMQPGTCHCVGFSMSVQRCCVQVQVRVCDAVAVEVFWLFLAMATQRRPVPAWPCHVMLCNADWIHVLVSWMCKLRYWVSVSRNPHNSALGWTRLQLRGYFM